MSVDSRSRVENILNVILDQIDPSVLEPAQSRVEALLLLLEGKIEDLADLAGKLPIHICIEGEYNPLTGMPTISNPKVDIFYLVPSGSGTNVYDEWVYSGTGWEQFGGGGTGILPNFSIGTVTTLPEGSQATVTLTGTMQDPVLNFGIPEGQAGDEYTVLVQAQQPVQTSNKLWINPGNSDIVEVPTYEEFEEVAQDVDEVKGQIEDGVVNDVQIDGTSIVQNGVANVPIASAANGGRVGVVKPGNGLTINDTTGALSVNPASDANVKSGTDWYKSIVPGRQHASTFYGLAKAAGSDEKDSALPVGQYTDDAKAAIRTMLGAGDASDVDDLKSQLEQVIVYTGTETPVTPTLTTTNVYLKTDGTTDSSSSWKTSDFVDISESVDNKVTIRATLYGAYLGVAFYNASEAFVSGISGANASDYGLSSNAYPQLFTVDIPANTKYVRISGYKVNITEQTDLYILYYVSGTEDYVAGDFLADELGKKIDVSQGIANVGKVLTVGNDGDVVPTSSPWAYDLATKADKAEVHEIKDIIGEPQYKNLVDTTTFTANSYIKGADGVLAASTYYDATDYILLNANTLYYVGNMYIGSTTLYHAFYSSQSESTFLASPDVELTRDSNYHCTILVGATDVYVRFSAPHNKTDFYVSSYVDYYVAHTPMTFEEIASPMCRFHKILVIGDSISTDAYGNYKKWVSDLIDEGYFPTDLNNNSQHATGFVARYDSQPNDFITRIKAVQNPETYDLVVVFGGVNDANQEIPIGTDSDTDYTTYFKPALKEFYRYMCLNFVNARIGICLPLPCSTQNRAASVRGLQYTYSALQKTVAETYSLPILDLTNHGGFYPDAYREGIDYDAAQAFRMRWTLKVGDYDPDGIHPTEEYEKKFLAPMIKSFIESL